VSCCCARSGESSSLKRELLFWATNPLAWASSVELHLFSRVQSQKPNRYSRHAHVHTITASYKYARTRNRPTTGTIILKTWNPSFPYLEELAENFDT